MMINEETNLSYYLTERGEIAAFEVFVHCEEYRRISYINRTVCDLDEYDHYSLWKKFGIRKWLNKLDHNDLVRILNEKGREVLLDYLLQCIILRLSFENVN